MPSDGAKIKCAYAALNSSKGSKLVISRAGTRLAELTLAGVKKLQLGTTAGRVSCPGTSPVITISVLRFLATSAYQGKPRESAPGVKLSNMSISRRVK